MFYEEYLLKSYFEGLAKTLGPTPEPVANGVVRLFALMNDDDANGLDLEEFLDFCVSGNIGMCAVAHTIQTTLREALLGRQFW